MPLILLITLHRNYRLRKGIYKISQPNLALRSKEKKENTDTKNRIYPKAVLVAFVSYLYLSKRDGSDFSFMFNELIAVCSIASILLI